jgi:hypothetical protein
MIGEQIGNFRVIDTLGEGGMGVVYLGQHLHLPRRAAIKVLRHEIAQSPQALPRFLTEARSNALVRHPAVVEVLDCGMHTDGRAYIVMEYLQGWSLARHLRTHPVLAAHDAALVARQIADALAAAHGEGIIHRDLKPENVFLVRGGIDAVKVLDFGIAKLMTVETTDEGRLTRTGTVLGTPVYMSPEQCRGTGEIDLRTDVYALGCILYEMTCGRPPFLYRGTGELIAAHLGEPPARPSPPAGTLPPALESLILRMLAKAASDRPAGMDEVRQQLEAVLAGKPAPVTGRAGSTALLSPRTAGEADAEDAEEGVPRHLPPAGGTALMTQASVTASAANAGAPAAATAGPPTAAAPPRAANARSPGAAAAPPAVRATTPAPDASPPESETVEDRGLVESAAPRRWSWRWLRLIFPLAAGAFGLIQLSRIYYPSLWQTPGALLPDPLGGGSLAGGRRVRATQARERVNAAAGALVQLVRQGGGAAADPELVRASLDTFDETMAAARTWSASRPPPPGWRAFELGADRLRAAARAFVEAPPGKERRSAAAQVVAAHQTMQTLGRAIAD